MTDTNKKFNQNNYNGNSRSKNKKIILEQDELSKGIECFEKFIETYAGESTGFPYACHHIDKGNITSKTIANFVNEGAKLLRSNDFNNKNDSNTFKQIATKIGQLIVNGKIELGSFTSQGIANTFNGLAKCYINLGEYLNTLESKDKNKFIGALVDKIKDLLNKKGPQEKFNFKSQELANTFNGLGKCYINLGGYLNTLKLKDKNKFIGALVDRIKDLLSKDDFNSQAMANTFNGLAKCGVNLGKYFETEKGKKLKNEFIGALVDKIKTLLERKKINSQELANIFNGLSQCGINLGGYLNKLENKYLKNDFIRTLVGEIKDLLLRDDFNSQGIANTFNGLAQCGINLGGYVNNDFIGALVDKIKTLLKQGQFTSQELANTFNGLAQCGINLGGYLNTLKLEDKNKFIGALVDRIKTLLEQEQFTSQELSNIINGLAQGGINLCKYFETEGDEDSKNAFIKALVDKIQILLNETNPQEQFTSQELSNIINGLAQGGINLGGYVDNTFIKALVDKIQILLNETNPEKQFTSQELANIINGLAQDGINLGEYLNTLESKDKNKFIGALVGKIQTLLKKFNSIDIANTFNGLVSLFLYNKDLYEKNRSQFKNIINNLVQKYLKLSNKDDQSNWTMLYNIKYLQVCGFEIDEEILSKITNLKTADLNNNHTNSTFETNFETFLKKIKLKNKKIEKSEKKDDCYESESKLIFEVASNTSFKKPVDFCIEFKHKNKIYKAYIELDGPTHFTDMKQTQKTPQTQIRDILTLQQLQKEQADNNTQILYVTLSANEFNEIKKKKKTKEDLLDFLTEKNQLKQITQETSNNIKKTNQNESEIDLGNGGTNNGYCEIKQGKIISKLTQRDDGLITVKSNYEGKPKDKKQKQNQERYW